MDSEPNVYKCDRCLRTFDCIKIVQGVYGTRHCKKCVKELQKHEMQNRLPFIESLPQYLENQC